VETVNTEHSESLKSRILHLLSLQEFQQKWYGWACLLPMLVLLAEFIFATEAVYVLLANFAGKIITLVSQKLHEQKCT
jgi:hypothetical protein